MADSERLDAYLTMHEGNYVLVMSPFVARCVRDMSGNILGSIDRSQTRQATNAIWKCFTEPREDGTPPLMQYRGVNSAEPLLFEGDLHPKDDMDE